MLSDTESTRPCAEIVTGSPGMLEQIESGASIFVVSLLGIMLIGLGGVFVFRAEGSLLFWPLALLWLTAMFGEFCFLVWLKKWLNIGLSPFIPKFALRQMTWPLLLRPLPVAFWLAHFSLTLLFVVAYEKSLLMEGTTWIHVVVLILVVWILTHCSLMFLFLAITALHHDAQLVDVLWRWRMMIDLVMTLVAVMFLNSRPG